VRTGGFRNTDPSSSVGLHRGKLEGWGDRPNRHSRRAGIIIGAHQAGKQPKGFDSSVFNESLC